MGNSLALRHLTKGGWKQQKFSPFREGIEICWLRQSLPQLALLRYAPGASVPKHRHAGLEIIQMLDGEQTDEHGTYTVGDIVLNEEGSEHSVHSESGCVALLMWERPVEFV